jgi:hypothetical protein
MKKILVLAMALALVAALAAPLAALAAADNTTEITADVGAAIVLTAPNPTINLGTMDPSTKFVWTGSATNAGSVSCNDHSGYSVTVVSDRADGKMVSTNAYTLGAALLVTTGSQSGVAVTSGTPLTCVDTSAPGVTAIPLSVSQTIAYTDKADTGYSITLTYTATPK